MASARRASPRRPSSREPTSAGIVWPRAIAPWPVELVSLGRGEDEATQAADKIYDELTEAGLDPLYDDRDAGAGEKLTDAELIGCPLRIVVGKRTLAEGQVEAQVRATGEDLRIDLADVAARAIGAGRCRKLGAWLRSGPRCASGSAAGASSASTAPGPALRRPRQGAPLHPLDAAEHRRLPAACGDPGLPGLGARLRRRARHGRDPPLPLHHAGRPPRRLPRPGDRPVLADGRTARPASSTAWPPSPA